MKKERGITLISLMVTIIVLLILSSIAAYSGIDIIESSKLTAFTAEMKIMQAEVNELYQKMQNGETIKYGEELLTVNELTDKLDDVNLNDPEVNELFTAVNIINESEKERYKVFNKEVNKKLNIEGVKQTFLIDILNRKVISLKGLRYRENMYYTLDSLPNGTYGAYNVEKKKTEKPSFDIDAKRKDGKWKLIISNIDYNGNIRKWYIKYSLDNGETWEEKKDYEIEINENEENNYEIEIINSGTYKIKLFNGDIESDEVEIEIEIEAL